MKKKSSRPFMTEQLCHACAGHKVVRGIRCPYCAGHGTVRMPMRTTDDKPTSTTGQLKTTLGDLLAAKKKS